MGRKNEHLNKRKAPMMDPRLAPPPSSKSRPDPTSLVYYSSTPAPMPRGIMQQFPTRSKFGVRFHLIESQNLGRKPGILLGLASISDCVVLQCREPVWNVQEGVEALPLVLPDQSPSVLGSGVRFGTPIFKLALCSVELSEGRVWAGPCSTSRTRAGECKV